MYEVDNSGGLFQTQGREQVAPLQTLMNDLISNVILLFGGGMLAFYTSWQLSVLALTVVPPISFVYRLYARWGQKINRGIWQAFGDSNSVATEALSNIRTVHAFSTEEYETNRYNDGINVALSYGHGERPQAERSC